jgi:hypothetical protein
VQPGQYTITVGTAPNGAPHINLTLPDPVKGTDPHANLLRVLTQTLLLAVNGTPIKDDAAIEVATPEAAKLLLAG